MSSNSFSSNLGLYNNSNAYSYNKLVDSSDIDFIATLKLTIPLLVRNTLLMKKSSLTSLKTTSKIVQQLVPNNS